MLADMVATFWVGTLIIGNLRVQLSIQGGVVRLLGLQRLVNGVYTVEGSAVCTFSITNADGSAVANATNVSMPVDASGPNNYTGVVPSTATIIAGNVYEVVALATAGGVSVPFQQRFRAAVPSGNSTPA